MLIIPGQEEILIKATLNSNLHSSIFDSFTLKNVTNIEKEAGIICPAAEPDESVGVVELGVYDKELVRFAI